MNRNFILPDVAAKLSLKAYIYAAKEFNQKQKVLYESDKIKNKPATLKSLQLKDTHHQVFYVIINYYKNKIKELNEFFGGSTHVMTYILPKRSLHVTTGRIAKHLERSNSTIRKRLARLEEAGLIQVVFHGHKKPLEIIFNKHVCIIYDRRDLKNITKSKFLKSSESDIFGFNEEKVQNKESTEKAGTIYNITITEKAGTTEAEISQNRKGGVSKEGSEEEKGIGQKKERKKVPEKKERKEQSLKEMREARFRELKEKAKVKQMTTEERAEYYKEKNKESRLKKMRKLKTDVLVHFSLKFYGYLITELFPDKELSDHYQKDTLNYISKYYFAKAKSVQEMEMLIIKYKKRVDISKKWINNYKNELTGEPFDTDYFYPLAYLDINKTGNQYLSFANTEKFIKQENEWKKMNGYNRSTDKLKLHELNKIFKKLQNGFINYQSALKEVEELSNETDEYIKQFNTRYFGLYKVLPK